MRLGIERWFKFESPEERKRKQEVFEASMFPLGVSEQKEWELSILRELFPKKHSLRDEHFQLLVLRESMLVSEMDHPDEKTAYRNGAIKAWYDRKTPYQFSREKKKLLIAIAICENDARGWDDLPKAANIRNLSDMIPF